MGVVEQEHFRAPSGTWCGSCPGFISGKGGLTAAPCTAERIKWNLFVFSGKGERKDELHSALSFVSLMAASRLLPAASQMLGKETKENPETRFPSKIH